MLSKENIESEKWHSHSIQELNHYLETNLETGLTSTKVKQRQEHYGANQLKSKPTKNPLIRFLEQFNQPLLYILLIAGAVKAFLGEWVSAWVIWAVTLINAIIGFVQEAKAENAIAALASAVQTETTVRRNGKKVRVDSTELVPGDLVLLTSGDKVPADLRLVEVKNLQINESALTGESVAVEKTTQLLESNTPLAERSNMAYAGSFVTSGQARGIVIAIAEATETGRISQLMESQTNLTTPLTRKFDKFSRTLLYIILGVAAFTFAVGWGYGNSWVAMFEAAVALAVSAIPEGLPAVVTVTLAIGVSRMARRHAIIRKLPAVETLGSATVICSDKTGTLTENQMTVQAIYAGGQNYSVSGTGYTPEGRILLATEESASNLNQQNNTASTLNNEQLKYQIALLECLKAGLLCNDSHLEVKQGEWVVVGDPTEGALIAAANKVGFTQSDLEETMPRLDVIPFESEYQYMATLHAQELTTDIFPTLAEVGSHHNSSLQTIYVKGSVEAILPRCQLMLDTQGNFDSLPQANIQAEVERMAQQGLRVLALGKKYVSAS